MLTTKNGQFRWIGQIIEKINSHDVYSYYESFTYDDETYNIGDIVLVKTDYGVQKLGRLLSFYECRSTNVKYKGTVRWYTKAIDLPKAYTSGILFDEKNEVVEDLRLGDIIISLENVMQRCFIEYVDVDNPIYITSEMNLDKKNYFFCRYCIETNRLVRVRLHPDTNELLQLKNLEKTPKQVKRKSLNASKYTDENLLGKVRSPRNPNKNVKLNDSVLTPNRAKRNLNESFDYTPNSQTDTSIVNYSIIEVDDERPLTLKLRLSERHSFNPKVLLDKLDDKYLENLEQKKSYDEDNLVDVCLISDDECKVEAITICDSDNEEQRNLRSYQTPRKLELRRSSRVTSRISYTEFISPTKLTPRRTRLQSYENDLITHTPKKTTEEVHRTPAKRTRSVSVTFEQDLQTASPAKRNNKKVNPKQTPTKSDIRNHNNVSVILEDILASPDKTDKKNQLKQTPAKPAKYQDDMNTILLSDSTDTTSKLKNRPKRMSSKPIKYLDGSDDILSKILYPLNLEPLTPRSSPKKRTTRTPATSFKNNVQETSNKESPMDVFMTPKKSKLNKAPATSFKNNVQETPNKESSMDEVMTPKKSKINKAPKKTPNYTPKKTPKQPPKTTPASKMKLIREGVITPSMQMRKLAVVSEGTPLNKAREKLHVSYVPEALPCREKEFMDVLGFVQGKLLDGCGGCMYVSGVPGTGKTATVTEVIRNLQEMVKSGDLPEFSYVNVNGMRLTEPRQSYVEILKQLTGKTVPWEQAQTMLEARFTKSGASKKLPIVLLVDELDILCTKRQDVVYNLLDWPTKAKAHLIVITIANTMDLPERLLMGRVTSRLGLTRLTFQAYTHKQLQEIVTKRVTGTGAFNPDAVQLVARKVASVSGDARRALDICRRAAEIAELQGGDTLVSMGHVNEALDGMITQPKVLAIKHCRRLEQLILQSVVAEVERTGVEETTFADIYIMLSSVAGIEGFQMVSISVALAAVSRLGACRLLLTEQRTNDLHQKIILNVSVDDIYYALRQD